MSRAIEKGATYLDKLCHNLYDEPKGRGFPVDGKCCRCGGPLVTYYCEDRLYLIVCEKCGTLALTKAVAPQVAANLTLRKPSITPPNDPLTIEQLREMDGEPVWIVDVGPHKWYGPGWAIADRENCLVRLVKSWNPIFFEKYGEWWLAYRRPPEGEEGDANRG